jgi:chemotaxis protein MotB
MGRRKHRHEEHTNHESWAIPYGDLITLLLAFFVVMYAISSVNEGKYRVLSDSLYAAFQGAPRSIEPVQTGDKQVGSGADIHTTIVQQQMMNGEPRALLDQGAAQKTARNTAVTEEVSARSVALTQASKALSSVADNVEQAMADLIQRDVVAVRRTDLWIEVEIRSDILFPSGSAQLSPDASGVIAQLAGVVAGLPNAVRVEGHTDNVPIKNALFYSNWELSAARAGSVVRMLAGHGVAPGRLAVVGLGQEHPAKTNDTPEGRNANRRVVIVILSTALTDPDSQPGTPRPQVSPDAVAPVPVAPGPAAATGTDHAD